MTAAAIPVSFDPLRDKRHREAKAARDQADWLAWLDLGGAAPITLEDYEWATARALRMFPNKEMRDFTDSDLAHILRTFPAKSRRVRKAAYQSWFKWGSMMDRIDRNPLDKLPTIARTPQKVTLTFTDAEIEALTSLPGHDGTLFLTLFDAGLRRSEAINLRVKECRLEQSEIIVRKGKGGKDRIVPITIRLTQALAQLFLLDALQPDDYLWPTRPGGYHLQRRKPMSQTAFKTWYTRGLESAGVDYRNPHTTRHTYATRWLRNGGRLETLSKSMGHASIKTTADTYGHLDNRDVAIDVALVEGR